VQVLTGEEEARLGFLAARRWYGWSAARLLHVDLGGGSLQISFGYGDEPDVAVSLPLGVGLLARQFLADDPPAISQILALRGHVEDGLRDVADRLRWEGPAVLAAASSKTFEQLARVCGAPRIHGGNFERHRLKRTDLNRCAERMMQMPERERARLPGVKPSRASQISAGAVIAQQLMADLGLKRVEICPWAVREGVSLRWLERVRGREGQRDSVMLANAGQRLDALVKL